MIDGLRLTIPGETVNLSSLSQLSDRELLAQVQRAARPVLRSGHDPSRFSSPTAARSSS